MSPARPLAPVIYRNVRNATAVGLAAFTAAPVTGFVAGIDPTGAWTAHPVQMTLGVPLKSTTGPMRFDEALDATGIAIGLGPSGIASADSVRTIYERSGLTWEQLARLFGVSRRAVHSWASGSRVSARHVEAIFDLVGRISRRAGSPEEVRAWLMDSASGPSIYEQIRQRNLRSPTEARLPAAELMGIA